MWWLAIWMFSTCKRLVLIQFIGTVCRSPKWNSKKQAPTLERFRAVPSFDQKIVLHLQGNIQLPPRKLMYCSLCFPSEIQRQYGVLYRFWSERTHTTFWHRVVRCKTLKEHTHARAHTHTEAFKFNFVPSISKRGHGAFKVNLWPDKRNYESKCFRQETEQDKVPSVEY